MSYGTDFQKIRFWTTTHPNYVQGTRSSSSQCALYTTNLSGHLKKPKCFHQVLLFRSLPWLPIIGIQSPPQTGLDLPSLCLTALLINELFQPNWSVMLSGFHLILHPGLVQVDLPLLPWGGLEVHSPHKVSQGWNELFILFPFKGKVPNCSHSTYMLPKKGAW